jgi:hypothetical protein
MVNFYKSMIIWAQMQMHWPGDRTWTAVATERRHPAGSRHCKGKTEWREDTLYGMQTWRRRRLQCILRALLLRGYFQGRAFRKNFRQSMLAEDLTANALSQKALNKPRLTRE